LKGVLCNMLHVAAADAAAVPLHAAIRLFSGIEIIQVSLTPPFRG
jgi:hypothetical protein